MAKIRALSLTVALGLTVIALTSPAAAYVVEAVTSIPAAEAEDKTKLHDAIQAAIHDVTKAVAFTPTVVSLLDAKIIGDRIFLFVLLADAAGESEIQAVKGLLPSLYRQ